MTESLPCYYCGETDLVRTSIESDQFYPLCHHCQTVRKLGPVKKRKKRTVEPREKKKKNKRKKGAIADEKDLGNFLDNLSDDSEQENDELHEEEDDKSADEESSDDSLLLLKSKYNNINHIAVSN